MYIKYTGYQSWIIRNFANLQHVLLTDVAFVVNDVLCVSLIIKSAREIGKNYDIVLTCEQT